MKKINIFYWITTGLILAMMLWSAIGSFTANPDGVKMMAYLKYPPYLANFLAVAKVLGIIAILVPGYPRLKEWAYAGFTFDLLGATYSSYAIGEPASNWTPMFIFIALLAASYILYRKRLEYKPAKNAAV